MADHAGFDSSDVYVYRGKGSVPRNVRRVEVDRSVKFIPDRLFKDCRQLESVRLHDGLLGIGAWAFAYCTSLRIIRCPSTVTEIGTGAFLGCFNLEEFELPECVEQINGSTFRECTSLEEVRIPASVVRIGHRAFMGCTSLASVGLREGLRMIGDCAFADCRSLGSLRVPWSVDEIGWAAFDGCTGLSLVQLHENLLRIKRFAFGGCPPGSFRFTPLLDRMEAICMGGQAKSMFESRLSEMALGLTREEDEDEDDSDDEEDPGAVWEKCKESLERAHEFLDYLELKGAVPVLELALWKGKIEGERGEGVQSQLVKNEDGGQDRSGEERERKSRKVTKNIGQDTRLSRKDCRVKCGAGIVIPEVLKFFTYRSSWPRMNGSEEGNVD